MNPKTYFITGSSGVGKSTLVAELKKKIPSGFAVYDFDELGVPMDADSAWRVTTTEKWITIAKENSTKGISTIVVGLTRPEEVQEVAQREGVEVKYCMLEVESEELKRRLLAHRFSTPERIANFKKYEGVTVEEFLNNNQDYLKRLRDQAAKLNALFIDTTKLSPEEVANRVVEWVLL